MLFKRNRTPTKHIYYALHPILLFRSFIKKSITKLISVYKNEPYIFGIGFNSITSQKSCYIAKGEFMNL
jgi:hypothetical protein